MAVTDIITLILSFFFLVRGASRGFTHSLTGPFSVIVATIISIVYYKYTGDMITSAIIGLLGPLMLNLFLKFLLKTWAASSDIIIKISFLSRLGGAILTIIWGWVFIIFTLILLTVLPPMGEQLTAMHNDVVRSNSYLIARPFEDIFFAGSKKNTAAATGDASSNAKSLADDPRFQKILQDPEIQQEINAHDFAGLMRNPKMMDFVQQIMSDPAEMKKVMAFYSSQPPPQAAKNP